MPKKFGLLALGLLILSGYIGLGLIGQGKTSLFVFNEIQDDKSRSQNTSLEEDLNRGLAIPVDCDVVIVGGGTGGTAAALQSSRMGVETCLVEESDWLGGMLTAAGVSAIDGREDAISGIFKEFLTRVENYYIEEGRYEETQECTVSWFCFEPSIGKMIFDEMVAKEEHLTVYKNATVDRVYQKDEMVEGIRFTQNGFNYIADSHVVVDATEFGDLMFMGNIPYDLGTDPFSKELHAGDAEACIQPLTYVAILEHVGGDNTIPEPANYDRENYVCSVEHQGCRSTNSLFDIERLLSYGALPGDKLMINIPSHSYGNDFHATSNDLDNLSREEILRLAKDYTLGFVYFMQTELSMEEYTLSDEFGTEDKLALTPYVRESRRLVGRERLIEDDILPNKSGRSDFNDESIAVGEYPIDLHFCTTGRGDIYHEIPPYQIPLDVTIPDDIDGFMVAEKNISVSHIVNGSTRLQPVTMQVGQAVGTTAALAVIQNKQPRHVDIDDVQEVLIAEHSRLVYFSDLPPDHYATERISSLALEGLVSGYPDLSFGTENPINYGEMAVLYQRILDFYEEGEMPEEAQNYFNENSNEEFISRAELASFINQFILEGERERDPFYKDVSSKDKHAGDINQLASLSIINPESSTFRPSENATRAESIMMIMAAIESLL